MIEHPAVNTTDINTAESIWVYWADEQGNVLADAWLKTSSNSVYSINVPVGTEIPDQAHSILLYPANTVGQAVEPYRVNFHDYTGNTELSGPGGNEINSWYYGESRPHINVQRVTDENELCIFDNGLVSVIDMNNPKDEQWHSNSGLGFANTANDEVFTPYQFTCDETPVNTAINDCELLASKNNIKLELSTTSDNITYALDYHWSYRAVVNLISNAIGYANTHVLLSIQIPINSLLLPLKTTVKALPTTSSMLFLRLL